MHRTASSILILFCTAVLVLGQAPAQPQEQKVPLTAGLPVPAGAVAVIDGQLIDQKSFIDAVYLRFAAHPAGQPTLENLVQQAIIDHQMTRRSLVITEAEIDKDFETIDKQIREQSQGQTDFETEMNKKGISKAKLRGLLRAKLALGKLAAADFGKETSSPVEQEQWLKSKRREAQVELDADKLPEDAAAKVYDDFITREEFAANMLQILDSEESVKLVEAQMQANLANRLCLAQNIQVADSDIKRVYDEKKTGFENDPKYQGVTFANFVQERYGMSPEVHKGSANFRREVCLTLLGEKIVDGEEAALLYREKEREFGPIYALRHIIIRGSDEAKFEGQMRKLAEAEKVAQDVWSRLDKGTMEFGEAASLFSEDARSKFKQGEWDSFTPAQLDKVEGGAKILELEPGQFTKPLIYSGGYRIVFLADKKPAPPMSPEIAKALQRERAFQVFADAWRDSKRGYDLARILPKGVSK